MKESKATDTSVTSKDDLYVTPKYLNSFLTNNLGKNFTHLSVTSSVIFTANPTSFSNLSGSRSTTISSLNGGMPFLIVFSFRISGYFTNSGHIYIYIGSSGNRICGIDYSGSSSSRYGSFESSSVLMKVTYDGKYGSSYSGGQYSGILGFTNIVTIQSDSSINLVVDYTNGNTTLSSATASLTKYCFYIC